MKIGVRAHDFGRHKAGELSRIITAAGFETVQLALTKAIEGIDSFEDINETVIEDVSRFFGANGLPIAVLGCYIEPSLPDKAERLKNVNWFRGRLADARKLGASLVGTETTHFPLGASAAERTKAYKLLVDSVLRMAEAAEKEGILIGIEPVAEHVLNTPELAQQLFYDVDSDKLRIIFDPVNLLLPDTVNQQERIYNELFSGLGERIAVLHMKDTVMEEGRKAWRNIGEGIVNYPFIFEWLHKNRPDVPVLREEARMDSYQKDIEKMKYFLDVPLESRINTILQSRQ